MSEHINLSQLKPWIQKRPWLAKPFAWFALIFLSWWIIPIAVLIENLDDVKSAFGDLTDVIRLPIVDDRNEG